ncbi:hypothetical protein Moror_4671 [Moniliophthora roreri MCA 2997]|uniref:Transmembrane protein n=2 Tax=Moniliophthora roreri TaxID=221103 RepID=V2WZJ6_MONRO|nr:hypothetical protein Moror_4671 [Moniliophthora roreri MCA 2997]KAI3613125.1 hypothetical protein WG66_001418 [Moniliophthora roreri]
MDPHKRPSEDSEKAIVEEKENSKAEEFLASDSYDRRQLSQQGFHTLSICAIFLAGIQGQVLSLTVGQDGIHSDAVTALFFIGLFADVFGAVLSFASARWFEMITDREAAFWRERQWEAQHKTKGRQSTTLRLVDRWVFISIVSGPYLVTIGLTAFVLGLLVYIYETQSLFLMILITLFCVFCFCFIPPFVLRHSRIQVLTHLRLQRRSDS